MCFPLETFNVATVVKETILRDLKDVPSGFALLIGTIYSLNLGVHAQYEVYL